MDVLAGQQANLVSKPVDTIIVPYRFYTLPNTDPHSSIKATEEYNAYERIAMACEDGER
jgi:hypothetical protein